MVTSKNIFKRWVTVPPYRDWKANATVTFMETLLPDDIGVGIGIDPGRKFAVAVLDCNEIRIISGEFDKADDIQYGIWASELMRNAYSWAIENWPVTVEGAAYKKPYGQTGLAYVRFGFFLPMHQITKAAIVPPATIRKAAFGHGNVKAKDLWPDINPNAAAAIGAALHAAGATLDTSEFQDARIN